MLDDLKKSVCQANREIVRGGLAIETWGNISGIDRESRCVVIKPSGVSYAQMKPQHMVVVSLEDGHRVEGDLRPSSDTPTHLELYRAFEGIGAVAHTHSLYATAWAQARKEIPVLGTTHADCFYGPIPCTRSLRVGEIKADYEVNTGKVIVERFKNLDPAKMPAVLVAQHGPFVWGRSVQDVVANAATLERVARMASETLRLNRAVASIGQALLDKHFLRKHGSKRYYGQGGRDG